MRLGIGAGVALRIQTSRVARHTSGDEGGPDVHVHELERARRAGVQPAQREHAQEVHRRARSRTRARTPRSARATAPGYTSIAEARKIADVDAGADVHDLDRAAADEDALARHAHVVVHERQHVAGRGRDRRAARARAARGRSTSSSSRFEQPATHERDDTPQQRSQSRTSLRRRPSPWATRATYTTGARSVPWIGAGLASARDRTGFAAHRRRRARTAVARARASGSRGSSARRSRSHGEPAPSSWSAARV